MAGDERQVNEPLTYTRFLACLDEACVKFGRVQRASLNKRTLTLLLNDIGMRCLKPEDRKPENCISIMGVAIEINDGLLDHIVKLDGRLYNTDARPLVSRCPTCGYPVPREEGRQTNG